MSLSRKDYVDIAAVLKSENGSFSLCMELSVIFLEDNPRFDQERFIEACGWTMEGQLI